jgi:hypothetical protein
MTDIALSAKERSSMHHEAFGEIRYDPNSPAWEGTCALPAFAEYGREPYHIELDEPDENFRNGKFPLTIQDYTGKGPSVQQANSFRHLQQNEQAVRKVVMTELLASYLAERGWAKLDTQWPLWGRFVRWLVGKQYETIEELKPAARCIGVEVSTLCVGDLAYLGFNFAAEWEYEHGLAIVYHPVKGAFWGDGTAISSITEADNFNDAFG